MSLPQLVIQNQFGEESTNAIKSSTGGNVPAAAVADLSIIANFSGGSAFPVIQTTQTVANKLPAKSWCSINQCRKCSHCNHYRAQYFKHLHRCRSQLSSERSSCNCRY